MAVSGQIPMGDRGLSSVVCRFNTGRADHLRGVALGCQLRTMHRSKPRATPEWKEKEATMIQKRVSQRVDASRYSLIRSQSLAISGIFCLRNCTVSRSMEM